MPSPHPRLMAALPGFTGPTTYAAWPVWSDSARTDVRFQPIPKKAATRLWHRARDFDRQTKRGEGCHGGAVGPTALKVLEVLTFDFLNFRTGRLDPSYEAIARKANICVRAVASALQRLKELRILNWARRCKESRRDDGQYVLEQETNAYAVLPASQWRGYREPPEAPPPAPGTWGAPVPVLGMLDQAGEVIRTGGTMRDKISVLATDPADRLALALARMGASMVATGRAA
jgi:hypothetical protein